MKNAHELAKRYQEAFSADDLDVGALTDVVQACLQHALGETGKICNVRVAIKRHVSHPDEDPVASMLIELFEQPLPDLMVFVPHHWQVKDTECWEKGAWFRVFHIRSCQTHGMHVEEVVPPFVVEPADVIDDDAPINPNLN